MPANLPTRQTWSHLPAIFSCSTELFEGDLFRDDGVFGDADTYGGYVACDTLWFESPFGSDYESFAETCGALSEEVFFGGREIEFG